eukprot:COSAG02_NODE_275_length_26232_cov_85.210424_12_plen_79_part_00
MQAGEDPRKASRWAVMCAKRRQFEREHAEDLRRSAIFIKYTVGCFVCTRTLGGPTRWALARISRCGAPHTHPGGARGL